MFFSIGHGWKKRNIIGREEPKEVSSMTIIQQCTVHGLVFFGLCFLGLASSHVRSFFTHCGLEVLVELEVPPV